MTRTVLFRAAPAATWLLTVAVVAGGCATGTAFTATWANPAHAPVRLDGQKTVALVISTDDPTRRRAEDALAAELTARGVQGIAAWTILPTDAVRDETRARAAIANSGARAVVVMEVLARTGDDDQSDTGLRWGSTNYQGFWPHYNWAWGVAWSPQLSARTNVWIETLVYTLEPDTLVWGGHSRTGDPADVAALFVDVANAAAAEMQRSGLIAAPGA